MQGAIWALPLAMCIAPACWAVQSADSWDNLKQLRDGQKIEVVEVNLKSLRGEFVSVTDGAISLRTDEGETTIERERVTRVSVKGKGHRVRNTILGTLIGGAIGGSIAAANTGSWIEWQEATAAAVGFGGGAAAGAAVPTGGWKAVYRRR